MCLLKSLVTKKKKDGLEMALEVKERGRSRRNGENGE